MIGTEDHYVLGAVVTMPLEVAGAIIETAIRTRREEGILPLTVAVLAGHSDPSTLAKVYAHLNQNPAFLLGQAKKAAS